MLIYEELTLHFYLNSCCIHVHAVHATCGAGQWR